METNFIDLMTIITMARLWLEENNRKAYYFAKESDTLENFRKELKDLAEREGYTYIIKSIH